MCRAIALAAAVWAVVPRVTPAQTAGPGSRSGGLLPTRETPSISGGMTRDELLRRFDLDADGRIDEAEAEAARARMRRDRVEALQNSGLDPLTGRPRNAPAEPTADPQLPLDDLRLMPGSAPDKPQAPRKPDADAAAKPAAQSRPTVPLGRSPVMTGGVRAGAPAVRPGYGASGPKPDLNAGRPREPQPPPGATRTRTGIPPAGRTPQQPAARTAAPRPSLFPQGSTRPMAEDIGR